MTAAPDTGLITGTLTYPEGHTPTSAARAVVVLVDGTNGPLDGTTIGSTVIQDPGPQPIAFELTYPFDAVTGHDTYRVYAGMVDGDYAWVSPTGVSVDVPQPVISGLQVPMEYRPDLLKGAVTGTITGQGLDPQADAGSYGTAFILDAATGATVGFQLISPVGPVPVPFSVPYDPSSIQSSASYVAHATMWDGSTMWDAPIGAPVITNGNPKSDVALTLTPAEASGEGGLSRGLLLLLVLLIGGAIVGFIAYRRRMLPGTAPITPLPPPPPGSAPPPPPGSGPGAAAAVTPAARDPEDLASLVAPESEPEAIEAQGQAPHADQPSAPAEADAAEADASATEAVEAAPPDAEPASPEDKPAPPDAGPTPAA